MLEHGLFGRWGRASLAGGDPGGVAGGVGGS